MAKPKNEVETPVETQTPAGDAPAATEGAAPTAAKKAGGAAIMITTASGESMRRIDYIRQEFAKGRKRGEIAKELGVAYQIVFAATKPAKDEAAPAEAGATDTAAAEQAAA